MMRCGRDNVEYSDPSGTKYTCDGELFHSKAVMKRHSSSQPTVFLMSNLALKDQIFCLCNFPMNPLDPAVPMKLAGSAREILSALPGIVGEYKVRRLLFDEVELHKSFQQPGIARLTAIVPYVDDGHRSLVQIQRPKHSVSASPKSESSGCLKVFVWVAVILFVLFLAIRSCS